ncbi:MAG: hypothetical protein QM324_02875 [Bacteroidota bacterium]|nr:hypothetical protein [Bacteroidota bacterium]
MISSAHLGSELSAAVPRNRSPTTVAKQCFDDYQRLHAAEGLLL